MGRFKRAGLALLLFAGVFFGLAAVSPAQAIDVAACKEYPSVEMSDGPMYWVPESEKSSVDPFEVDSQAPQLTYGWNTHMETYDLGCNPLSGALPAFGNGVGNIFGLKLPSFVSSFAYLAMRSIAVPSWAAPLDERMSIATSEIAGGTWTPYASISLLIVAAIVMRRGGTGRLAGAMTATLWALAVIVTVTWTVSYPTEAPRLVDKGVQAGVQAVGTSFDDADQMTPGGGNASAADARGGADDTPGHEPNDPTTPRPNQPASQKTRNAIDSLFGQIWYATNYRTFLQGMFGDPESATAKKYGPELFRSLHMPYEDPKAKKKADSEPSACDKDGDSKECKREKMGCDPGDSPKECKEKLKEKTKDKGTAIYYGKENKAFEKVAKKIKDEDPAAYQHLTGKKWENRVLTGIGGFIVAAATLFFIVVAAAVAFLAYLVIRVAVPFSPALGVVFMFDALREKVMSALQLVGGLIIGGPLYLAASLIVLRVNTGVMDSTMNGLLKLLVVTGVSFIAWKLMRPGSFARQSLRVRYRGRRRFGMPDNPFSGNRDKDRSNSDRDRGDRRRRRRHEDQERPFEDRRRHEDQERPNNDRRRRRRRRHEDQERPFEDQRRHEDQERPFEDQRRHEDQERPEDRNPQTRGTFVDRPEATDRPMTAGERRSASAWRLRHRLAEHERDDAPTPEDTTGSTRGEHSLPWRAVAPDATDETVERRAGYYADHNAPEPRDEGSSSYRVVESEGMVPVDHVPAAEIDENNLTYGPDGEAEFVVYNPDQSRTV